MRPYVSVSKSSNIAQEGQGPFTVYFTLSSPYAAPINVSCFTPIGSQFGSAVPDVDFIPVSATLSWDANTMGTKLIATIVVRVIHQQAVIVTWDTLAQLIVPLVLLITTALLAHVKFHILFICFVH